MSEHTTVIGQDSKITIAIAGTFLSLFVGAKYWLDSKFEESRSDIATRFETVAAAQTSILLRLERMESRANDFRDEIKEIKNSNEKDVSELEFENWILKAEKANPNITFPQANHGK